MEAIGLILSIVAIPLFVVGLVMLIIQAIRKKKKKASLIVLIASIVLFVGGFGLFAAGDLIPSTKQPTEQQIEDAVTRNAESYIIVHCTRKYDCKTVQVHATTVEIAGNIATVKGKVSIIDDYGDKYQAKFDYTVKIDADGEFYDTELEMETPTRSK